MYLATVIYYETPDGTKPVQEYIEELAKGAGNNKQDRVRFQRIVASIRNLEQIGYRYVLSSARDINGVPDLWELRPGGDRVFFLLVCQDEFVLLHAFEKKTQKTPANEIARAKREIQDYLSRRSDKQ